MVDSLETQVSHPLLSSPLLSSHLFNVSSQEPVGPGWVARDISEIKPGAFQAMRSLENQFDSLRKDDVRERATTDPMYKYYKRLLPKPRYGDLSEESVNQRLNRPYI